MLLVKNLTVNVSGDPLFEGMTFTVQKNDRIGIVGPNGAGKSTLLKTILGQVEPDRGTIEKHNERVGYLPQVPEEPNSALSGGQKTRKALDALLRDKPTILLLDEPTNHLDTDSIDWLEESIKAFKGAVIIVSHDRTLLDHVVTKIIEIDSANHTWNEYMGGYSAYVVEREKRLALQEEAHQQQQKEKKRLEQWLANKRQEAAAYPDPAKGKQIRAMEKRIKREIYDQAIQRPKDFSDIKGLTMTGDTARPKLILRVTDIAKSYDTKPILKGISFEIRGQERVLLTGKNGSGKTTLLKIVMQTIQSDAGEVKIGEGIQVGYFAQEHETLDPKKSVIEEFESTPGLRSTKDARSVLGGFLFHGQDVFKKVASLSLGERVRLIFAKLTQQENQLLLLDEPTNHLDILSREVVEAALNEYRGAILAVSHDRYFIERVGFIRKIHIEKGLAKESLL